MNIQGMGPMQGMMGMGGMQQSAALTDDQKKTVLSILSKYKSDSLTTSDAQSIFKQFMDAGITPTRGLKEAIESAGFDAEDLRTKAFEGMQGAQGMQGMPPPPPPMGASGAATELTDDQKTTVASILAKYDSSNLTTTTAQAIFKELNSAGITPMKGLKEAIESAGFDAEKLRSLAMPQETSQNLFWASQKSSQTINTSALKTLESILSQYDFNNLSTDQETSLITELSKSGLLQSGSMLNLGV
jgi:hypothetical protein